MYYIQNLIQLHKIIHTRYIQKIIHIYYIQNCLYPLRAKNLSIYVIYKIIQLHEIILASYICDTLETWIHILVY